MARAIALLLLLAVLALLYLHVGRGQSLNYVYGGAYLTVLSTVLRFTPPGRLSVLTAGASASGCALSTKYNACFLLVDWLAGLASPRSTHFIRFGTVAAVSFFLFSRQIARHPAEALSRILYEARHQRGGFIASQLAPRVLWIFEYASPKSQRSYR